MCRAGAGTVGELAALGIPAAPAPPPPGHAAQRLPAGPGGAAGGGQPGADAQLDAAWVAREVPALLGDPGRLDAMAAAAAGAGVRDGAARVADLVAEAVAGAPGARP